MCIEQPKKKIIIHFDPLANIFYIFTYHHTPILGLFSAFLGLLSHINENTYFGHFCVQMYLNWSEKFVRHQKKLETCLTNFLDRLRHIWAKKCPKYVFSLIWLKRPKKAENRPKIGLGWYVDGYKMVSVVFIGLNMGSRRLWPTQYTFKHV